MKAWLVLATVALGLTACDRAGNVSLDNDDQKALYAIGHDMGSKLQTLQLSDSERKVLESGLRDGLNNTKAKVEMKDAFPLITNLIRTRNEKTKDVEIKDSEAFMDKASKEAGIVKLDSGILMKVEKEGTGETPKETDQVKVHYHGTLRDGKVFDSSVDRGEPAVFGLNQVIKCWTDGLQKMKVGGKAKLYCPSAVAYGDRGAPPDIKPGAALVFDVELLEIVKGGPSGTIALPEKEEAKKEVKKEEKKK